MFKYGINCAFEPLEGMWPAVLRGTIEQNIKDAAAIGYDGVELFLRDPQKQDGAYIKRLAGDEGLLVAAISTGLEFTKNGYCLIDESPQKRAEAVKRMREHIDLAFRLDSLVIIGIVRGNIPDFTKSDVYFGYLTECLLELSDYAQTLGVGLVVEAIMRYINNYLCSVPDTVDYIRSLGRKNIGVHIDSHHIQVEDLDIRKAVTYCGDSLKYIHFSDSNRAYPGGGAFDFKAMMSAMMDVKYDGFVTIESAPLPSPYECADRGLRYMKHLCALLEIERMGLGRG